MKTRNSLYLLLISFLLLAGCDAFQDADPYPYDVLAQGTSSGIRTPVEQIIDTRTEWQQFWQMHTSRTSPPLPLPEVDFAASLLVALYAGDQPTNGYSIAIIAVREKNSDVRIDYRIAGSGGPLPTVTQPFAILRMQRPTGGISIRKG
ncbi:protease complex subunit PrcB family protein [bacterium]|nr:protease complex subunit PrcB family protein [bacterium]